MIILGTTEGMVEGAILAYFSALSQHLNAGTEKPVTLSGQSAAGP
jgi:hypothetical protein